MEYAFTTLKHLMNPNFDNISWNVNALQLLEEHSNNLIPYAELNLPTKI